MILSDGGVFDMQGLAAGPGKVRGDDLLVIAQSEMNPRRMLRPHAVSHGVLADPLRPVVERDRRLDADGRFSRPLVA